MVQAALVLGLVACAAGALLTPGISPTKSLFNSSSVDGSKSHENVVIQAPRMPLMDMRRAAKGPSVILRRENKGRSTSSSSGEEKKKTDEEESGADKESLGLTVSEGDSTDDDDSKAKAKKKDKKKDYPKSTAERHGWRKWHRKCTKCPEDMRMKWRDPGIKWICGAYQRARRSFKSLCSMHLRNCQDGTMFTKIHDHRCANDSETDSQPHGEHFLYDYKVALSDDTTNSDTDDDSEEEEEEEEEDSKS